MNRANLYYYEMLSDRLFPFCYISEEGHPGGRLWQILLTLNQPTQKDYRIRVYAKIKREWEFATFKESLSYWDYEYCWLPATNNIEGRGQVFYRSPRAAEEISQLGIYRDIPTSFIAGPWQPVQPNEKSDDLLAEIARA